MAGEDEEALVLQLSANALGFRFKKVRNLEKNQNSCGVGARANDLNHKGKTNCYKSL